MGVVVAHNGGGGELEIPKCSIYTLEWDFDEQASPFLKRTYNIIHQYPIIRKKTNKSFVTNQSDVAMRYF